MWRKNDKYEAWLKQASEHQIQVEHVYRGMICICICVCICVCTCILNCICEERTEVSRWEILPKFFIL